MLPLLVSIAHALTLPGLPEIPLSENGEDLALASDAGTPVVSDPGLDLVALARREGIGVALL